MSSSLLGSALGIIVSVLLVGCTVYFAAGDRKRSVLQRGVVVYARPDWLVFTKTVAAMVAFLGFLHWLPEIIWLLATRFPSAATGLSERRYEALLFVGHSMALVAVTTNLLGNLWATWHVSNRTRVQESGTDA